MENEKTWPKWYEMAFFNNNKLKATEDALNPKWEIDACH